MTQLPTIRIPPAEVGAVLEFRVDASGELVEARVLRAELISYRKGARQWEEWLSADQVELDDAQDYSRVPTTLVAVAPAPQVRAADLPANWPDGVPGPTTAGWTGAAVNWLLEQVPAGYRAHDELLRAYPLVLAQMALTHLLQAHAAVQEGYRGAAYQLRPFFEAHTIAAILATYQAELDRIMRCGRAARLIEQALLAQCAAAPQDEPHAHPVNSARRACPAKARLSDQG